MKQKEVQYFERHVTAEIHLLLAQDLKSSVTERVEHNAVLAAANISLSKARAVFEAALPRISIPADALPGDAPMVQVELSYFELLDGADCGSTTMTFIETECFDAGKAVDAIASAVQRAMDKFSEKVPKITFCTAA